MKIEIQKPTVEQLEGLNVYSWPIWQKEVSKFPWTYDSKEICYVIEGEIFVETKEETIHILPGHLVTFPAGLSCIWDIRKAVRKHYDFPA